MNYSESIRKIGNIEKIRINFYPFQDLIIHLYLSLSHNISETSFYVQKNTKTKVTFLSFSTQKLSSKKKNCIPEEEVEYFGEDYFEFCSPDCYFKLTSQLFGCIPFDSVHVYFDRDILKNGYKLCDFSNFSNMTQILKSLRNECEKSCKNKCKLINFDTNIET